MNRKLAIPGTLLLFCVSTASAQINIAAIAQFKSNQQHALARSLARTQPQPPTDKHHHHAARATPTPAKPFIIHARNPVFRGNYTDMHTRNVR